MSVEHYEYCDEEDLFTIFDMINETINNMVGLSEQLDRIIERAKAHRAELVELFESDDEDEDE